MNFEGFCIQCLCASCEGVGKCEILYPSTEDYCKFYCQGGEFSMISCIDYKAKDLSSSLEE
jgi:hypothetical protein